MGRKYMIESYREGFDKEALMEKLYKAKMAICEVMEELDTMDEEMNERNYRMNNRINNRGRYDY